MTGSFEELKQRGYLESTEVIKVGKFTRIKFTRVGAALPTQNELPPAPEGPGAAETPKVDSSTKNALAALYDRYGTSDALKQVWVSILQDWESTMGKEMYAKLDHSVLLDVHDSTAILAIHPHIIDWAERQFSRIIRSSLTLVLKTKITNLEFIALGKSP